MDYAELPLPTALADWVAAVWTASVPEGQPDWVEQEAVPDGCIELIHRRWGRSFWRREQPELFATGLATTTAKLRLSAGSSFVGVKLWPWAWHALGGTACRNFHDDWIELPAASHMRTLIEGPIDEIAARLQHTLADLRLPPYAHALLAEDTVAGIVRSSGLGHRRLQRVFERDFGMPPRSYLRLLRFRDALAGVSEHETIAASAAEAGYADQAHMAREFRSLAGLAPSSAKARAKGPFV